MPTAVERALARHRTITVVGLAILTLLAWIWILAGAGTGMKPYASLALLPAQSQDALPMAMIGAGGEQYPGPLLRLPIIFVMWWIMMVAMMLPSAAPTILLYSRVAGHSGVRRATASFLAGYLLTWGAFSLAAAVLQDLFTTAQWLSSLSASQDRWLSAVILTAAGVYQLSPLKDMCLRHCRNTATFISHNFRPGKIGAMRMGAVHGIYCVGCCWLLMALLFVGGVMNLLWIALLTLTVAAEKLLPFGRRVAQLSGAAFIVAGALMFTR